VTLLKTRLDKSRQRLLCGTARCAALGEVRDLQREASLVQLYEGFRRDKSGAFSLHRHAEQRYKRGLPPRDAHGRWFGVPNAEQGGSWGPGPNTVSLHGGPQRERLSYREEVGPGALVKCPRCGFINEVAFDVDGTARVC